MRKFDPKSYDQIDSFHRLRYLLDCERTNEVYYQLLNLACDTIWGRMISKTQIDYHYNELRVTLNNGSLSLETIQADLDKSHLRLEVGDFEAHEYTTSIVLDDFGDSCNCYFTTRGNEGNKRFKATITPGRVTVDDIAIDQ